MKNILTVLIFLSICWCAFLIWEGIRDRSGPCVLEYPRYVVSAGLTSPSQQELSEYYLYYRGRRKVTGEICAEPMCVTKKEYECFMRDK